MYFRESRTDWGAVLLIVSGIALVAFIGFIIFDRVTGTTKLEMGAVIDKHHEHIVHSHTRHKSNGRVEHYTDSHDYYYIVYQRKDGRRDQTDVGYWYFNDYCVGEQVVLRYTIGGRTGKEYFVGLEKFKGAEQ